MDLGDLQHAARVFLLDVLEPGQGVQAGPAPRGRHVRAGEEGELAVMCGIVASKRSDTVPMHTQSCFHFKGKTCSPPVARAGPLHAEGGAAAEHLVVGHALGVVIDVWAWVVEG